MNWKWIKIVFIGLLVVCLIVFISNTDIEEVGRQISTIGWGFIGILMISGASLFMGTLAWKFCFLQPDKVGLSHLFMVRTIGEMITTINPTNIVAGEASKIHLLGNYGFNEGEKTDSILIARILLIAMQLLLTMFCAVLLAYKINVLPQFILLLCIIVVLLRIIAFIFSKININFYHSPLTQSIRKVRMAKIYFLRFMGRLKILIISRPRQMILAGFCSATHFVLGACELLLIFYFLKLDANFIDALTVDMGVVIIKSIGGFVPAQIGIEEFGNKYMLAAAGVKGAGVWISVSILRRAKQLFWVSAAGIFYMILKFPSKSRIPDYGNSLYNL